MRLTVMSVLMSFCCAFAFGQTRCHQDKVQTSPGLIIFMLSGQTFQVFPGQNRISSTWLPLDKITACVKGGNAYELTNISRGNQKVEALYKQN